MGDTSAGGSSLESFVRDHALHLTRFALLLTGDRGQAEDLVQDVLFAMHRRFGTQLGIDDPLRYAQRSIANANISRIRLRRVPELLSDQLPDNPSLGPDGRNSPDDDVWEALHGLPERQRAVLVLRYYLGVSDGEIAALLGCREGSVRSSAARAFKTLRPVLNSPDLLMGSVG